MQHPIENSEWTFIPLTLWFYMQLSWVGSHGYSSAVSYREENKMDLKTTKEKRKQEYNKNKTKYNIFKTGWEICIWIS